MKILLLAPVIMWKVPFCFYPQHLTQIKSVEQTHRQHLLKAIPILLKKRHLFTIERLNFSCHHVKQNDEKTEIIHHNLLKYQSPLLPMQSFLTWAMTGNDSCQREKNY